MALYTYYTIRGKWDFEAYNDNDAIRLAFYYCWYHNNFKISPF